MAVPTAAEHTSSCSRIEEELSIVQDNNPGRANNDCLLALHFAWEYSQQHDFALKTSVCSQGKEAATQVSLYALSREEITFTPGSILLLRASPRNTASLAPLLLAPSWAGPHLKA